MAGTSTPGVAQLAQRQRHVIEPAQVGLAQDDADIGVRDQQAALVHHIGRPGLADLDARDHVPDELEVDLSDSDAAAAAGAGNRHGEIGLRFLAEVDRAHVALVGPGMPELGVLAHVRLARELVHGEPRHLDLLAAVAVDVAHLGDGRGLPQQAQEIETALLEAAARGQESGRPADLALDLLDELLDDGGGALRLLALHGNQRLPAFAVGVVHLDGGIDDESAADQRDQHCGILAKQAATLLGAGDTKRREALAPPKARAVPRFAADTADRGGNHRQRLSGRPRQGNRGRGRCLYARSQCRHSRLLMYPQGSGRAVFAGRFAG